MTSRIQELAGAITKAGGGFPAFSNSFSREEMMQPTYRMLMGDGPERSELMAPVRALEQELEELSMLPLEDSDARQRSISEKIVALYRLDEDLVDLGADALHIFDGGYSYALSSLTDRFQQMMTDHPGLESLSSVEQAQFILHRTGFSTAGGALASFALRQTEPADLPKEALDLVDVVIRAGGVSSAIALLDVVPGIKSRTALSQFVARAATPKDLLAALERADTDEIESPLVSSLCRLGSGLDVLKALQVVSCENSRCQLVDKIIERGMSGEDRDFFLALKLASSKIDGALLERVVDVYKTSDNPDLAQIALRHIEDSEEQVRLARLIVKHKAYSSAQFALRINLTSEAHTLLIALVQQHQDGQ